MIAGIDVGIDDNRVHIMNVDDWYDMMVRFDKNAHQNHIILNPDDGGVWIVGVGDKPGQFLWVYDGYIPMFEDGKCIGYGTFIAGEHEIRLTAAITRPAEFPKFVPPKYIANIRVTGSPARWKNRR